MRTVFPGVLVVALLVAGCGGGGGDSNKVPPPAPATIKVSSPAFKDGGRLPVRFTCDGKFGGVNPPLGWSNKPGGVKSQALVVEDPDAPGGNFVHWTVWGMMARTNGLDADIPPLGLPQGQNSAGTSKYSAPCPPKGDPAHHYHFTIYALKAPIELKPGAPSDLVLEKIAREALARGVLTGTYSR